MKFRYDINALRAIAIIGVLLFHYKVPYADGGFSGVDVFFVISGYLMSRIILNGIDKGAFSLIEFYKKRVDRIVPALLVLVVSLTVLGFFLYFPDDYQINGKNATGSLLFLSNVLYWKSSNYFDPSAESNIFLHTWSLSVEWQFYMIFPIILLFLKKFIKTKISLLTIFTLVTGLLFLGSIFYTRKDPTASFYLLPSRAWEMMFGGIAFLSEDFVKNFKYRRLTAIIGYVGIFVCFVYLNSAMSWPGKYTLVPIMATFLVVVSNYNDFYILKNRVVQFVGSISYSLYLWHWPVYVINTYLGFKSSWQNILILLIISFGLAYLSFKLVEQLKVKTKWVLLPLCVVGSITLCFTFFKLNQIAFSPKVLEMASYKFKHTNEIDEQFRKNSCFIGGLEDCLKLYDKSACLNLVPGKKNILLIGDSHAAQFAQSLSEKLNNSNVHISQVTASRCSSLIIPAGEKGCVDFMNFIYHDYIKKNSKNIDGVIICNNWVERTGENLSPLLDNIKNTIRYLESLHIKVAIIGQNDIYTIPYPLIRAKELQYRMELKDRYLNKNVEPLNAHFKQKLSNYYIDLNNVDYSTLSQNTPYLFDENHFTKAAADIVASKIVGNLIYKKLISD